MIARCVTCSTSPVLTLVVLSGMLLPGCGGSKGSALVPVTGKVVKNGQPVAGAEVMFLSKEKAAPASGMTDDAGAFTLKYNDGRSGAVPGKYQVRITLPRQGADAGGGDKPPPVQAPPEEYQLEANVAASGTNDLTLEVGKSKTQ